MNTRHVPIGRQGWSSLMADVKIANYRVIAVIAGNREEGGNGDAKPY